MMRWIVGSSLRFRRLVVALAVGVMILGIVQVGKSRVDALPEFTPTMVEVQTEALGLSAEEVEQMITVPLEQDLLVGVPFLTEIESASLPGLSSVLMTFEPGTDLLDARQVVQERLTQADRRRRVAGSGQATADDPAGVVEPSGLDDQPVVGHADSDRRVGARPVGDQPAADGVPGVANVTVWGFRDRQLQVLVDPQRLRQSNTTLAAGHRNRRQCVGSLATHLPRGLDPRHRWVHRHRQPAAEHLS